MIGIVLVTHGRLAAEFRAALEHVVGPQKQIESIAIGPDDDIEQRRQDIVSAVRNVDSGSGVVVFTDMFGGTPSNLAISIMNGSNIEVIERWPPINIPSQRSGAPSFVTAAPESPGLLNCELTYGLARWPNQLQTWTGW
jgi:PTS system fructose IIA component